LAGTSKEAEVTPTEFIAKWKPVTLTERAAAHSHFLDLCTLLGHDDPVKADPTGKFFTFEKGATKTGGGEGFADVWKKGFFAWEYKKKKRNLDLAMEQLVRYAAALENPPLQVVCDTDRFIIRTAWTNSVPETFEIGLDELVDPAKLDILHSVFFDPEKLRPTRTRAGLTKEAADKFSEIALRLGKLGTDEQVAHFINQLVFCFFANSVKLLPDGFLSKLLDRAAEKPERAQGFFNQLFAAMETGGEFDLTAIKWFNGGLFDGRNALPLDATGVELLQSAAAFDWSQIDPSIFGSLFERFLDPAKRAQVGTHNTGVHYTDAAKIMMIVEPVILRPLRAEWEIAKAEIEGLLQGKIKPPMRAKVRSRMSPKEAAEEVRQRYLERLRRVRILDPACGSGNFLYLALQGVKDLENFVNLECESLGLAPQAPMIGPEIVHGIEINALAAELARTTIWIGDIQWRRRNSVYSDPPPILRKLESIECRDALLTKKEDGKYIEAQWPLAEFIVGNPPFLGGQMMRAGLGEDYAIALFQIYDGRVASGADLVTYWFEKARLQIEQNLTRRAGLVATNSIRGGSSRRLLDRILQETRIFEAWSDEPWVVDGAAVRVSLVCFGQGDDELRLDDSPAISINSDLTADVVDLTKAKRLKENLELGFQGPVKVGPFDIAGDIARDWLMSPLNPNGKPNSDVLYPWMNGSDIVRYPSGKWIIDFDELSEKDASLYELPFEYVAKAIKPIREANKDKQRRENWWRLGRSGGDLKAALSKIPHFILTPRVAKHRIFVWAKTPLLPDSAVVAIARDDDTTFGILHSRFHEIWSLRLGTSLEDRPRYTPTTTFETFPFPERLTPNIPAKDYAGDPHAVAISEAAASLDNLRRAWLYPADLVRIKPEVVPTALNPDAESTTVEQKDTAAEQMGDAEPLYPDRILPKDAAAEVILRTRTLTKLYNLRPKWLIDAHLALDTAVAAAYGWPADISEEDALAKLLELNFSRIAVPRSGKATDADGDLLDREE
jgi:type II restriction/modification system DNA methylase subunit YeeA